MSHLLPRTLVTGQFETVRFSAKELVKNQRSLSLIRRVAGKNNVIYSLVRAALVLTTTGLRLDGLHQYYSSSLNGT